MKTLTKEQIDKIHKNTPKAFGELDCLPDEFDQLCRLALIGRQCLDAEPVAWLHKETKELNNGWDAILDNTGNWIPLIDGAVTLAEKKTAQKIALQIDELTK